MPLLLDVLALLLFIPFVLVMLASVVFSYVSAAFGILASAIAVFFQNSELFRTLAKKLGIQKIEKDEVTTTPHLF